MVTCDALRQTSKDRQADQIRRGDAPSNARTAAAEREKSQTQSLAKEKAVVTATVQFIFVGRAEYL